jgi:hypothetical protein
VSTRSTFAKIGITVLVGVSAFACGSSKPATFPAGTPGPNVVGFTIPTAQAQLKASGVPNLVAPVDHPLFGIVIPSDWIVCSETDLSGGTVRLNVSNNQCDDANGGN